MNFGVHYPNQGGGMMNLAEHASGERTGFRVVCVDCGGLSIKIANPAKSPVTANVKFARCDAVRGTLGDLHELARRSTDDFEF
jgi:hypothetical protein